VLVVLVVLGCLVVLVVLGLYKKVASWWAFSP